MTEDLTPEERAELQLIYKTWDERVRVAVILCAIAMAAVANSLLSPPWLALAGVALIAGAALGLLVLPHRAANLFEKARLAEILSEREIPKK